MSKAYAYGADRLWVFNVGDLKPAEMKSNRHGLGVERSLTGHGERAGYA